MKIASGDVQAGDGVGKQKPVFIQTYLDLLDAQREKAYACLEGLTSEQVWRRPAPRQWCIGEILDHNYLLIKTTFPYVRVSWKLQHHRARKRRAHIYVSEIDDPYRKPSFPMWVGFLWKPRFSPRHPVSLDFLENENRNLHAAVRAFYMDKDPDMLGNVFLYDPLFGWINLIVTLRIGIYHDQLHFDDVLKIRNELQGGKQ